MIPSKSGLVFLFLWVSVGGYAQSQYIVDSLKNVLRSAKTDSVRVVTLSEMAIVYGTRNTTVSISYCDTAWRVASHSKENPVRLECYVKCAYAHIYRYAGDSVKCEQNIQEAEALAETLHDKVVWGLVYHQRALYYGFFPQMVKEKLDYLLKSADLLESSGCCHRTLLIDYHVAGLVFQRLGDINKSLQYAKKASRHAKNANDRILADYNYAGAHTTKGFSGAGFEQHIDSAIFFLKDANRLLKTHEKRVKDLSLIAGVSSMLSWLYVNNKYEYIYDQDSAIYYLEESRRRAYGCGDKATYANSSMILSKFYIDANNLDKAERILKEAKEAYYSGDFRSQPGTAPDLYLVATFLYQKKEMYAEAVRNYKEYMRLQAEQNDARLLSSVQNAEAKFLISKKEQHITALKEQEAAQRRTIYFLLLISGSGMTLFVFLYQSHAFRMKFFNAREALLEQQATHSLLKKEETERALQVEIEDSKRLMIERQLDINQKEQYQKELMTSVLHLERKNDLLHRLKESIVLIGQHPEEKKRVQKLIDENLELDNDFGRFSKNFELVYPNFFNKLKERATANLTQLDLRYCAYIHMGLSADEISNLLNIDPASIRKARYRLKQKFNLGREDALNTFIRNTFIG